MYASFMEKNMSVIFNFNKKVGAATVAQAAPPAKPAEPASSSIEQALALGGGLHKDSSPAEVREVLQSVAGADFDRNRYEHLTRLMQKRCGRRPVAD
ncbi:MAG TPA: hypothetical protein VEH77_20245 [Roseiarcus sp.]|nr:hypothetical protein [Roseiarcus sp.]